MGKLVAALFNDSQQAGHAIGKLKEAGYTKDISVISKDFKEGDIDTSTHQIKDSAGAGASAGATSGAAAGAVVGTLAAVITGIAATALPGGVVVAGPLAAAVLGAATGAATGGIVGFLMDKGVPDERAKLYQDQVNAGQTLVTVTADEDRISEVQSIMQQFGASASSIEEYNV